MTVPTSSQTVGPFVEIGCKYLASDVVVTSALGMVDAVIRGRVIDGDGHIVPDFMLEIWQTIPGAAAVAAPVVILSEAKDRFRAKAVETASRESDPSSLPLLRMTDGLSEAKDRSRAKAVAFARVMPLPDGSFAFHTSYAPPDADNAAPHLALLVFMRGLLKPVLTRMYFPDDPRNATDPALALVPVDRRPTLIAEPVSPPNALLVELEWNIVLQGAGETVFFEW